LTDKLTENLRNEISSLREKIEKLEGNDSERRFDRYFRVVFEQVAVGVALISKEGQWIRTNNKICDLLGYSFNELRGRPVEDMFAKDDADTINLIENLFYGRTNFLWINTRFINRYGVTGWINLRASPMYDPEGRVEKFVCIVDDITEQKQAQLEIEKMLRESQERVKTLSGLMPICAGCKKVRDDDGYWEQIEEYLTRHTDAVMSHGMCPECMDKFYGNESWYRKLKREKSGIKFKKMKKK
jgi:PAS domain S-box-containing protein